MNLFFELIQVALGHREKLSHIPTESEWQSIYDTTKRQTLFGVAFIGVERLPIEQRPPQMLKLRWLGMIQSIENRNRLMNQRSVEVSAMFARDGYRSCILKGQGNATLYPQPLRRQSGDIDIWLDGDRKEILRYTLKKFKDVPFKYQHVEFPYYKDIEVEVHYFPMYMQNPIGNYHLQRFFKQYKEQQFSNTVSLPEGAGSIAIPTPTFNAVYQLTHLFIHFIIEGVGLRHFLDYYYVLKHLQKAERADIVRTLKRINLYGFARAVMFVEHYVLGLEEEYLLTPVDEKKGKRLVEEIMQGGNFGFYETRYWKKDGGFVNKQWQKLHRNFRFLFDYPGEIAFEPFFRLYHASWRAYMRTFVLK